MAPPVSAIPVSELEAQLNTLPSGRARNPPIALSECALKELVQYKCNVQPAEKRGGVPTVVCEPVVRMLRRCQGGLSVETTAWEGWKAKQEGANS
ncbi:hypothetical protein COCC4DRAFT_57053 [Bipolaris maydis ATCC 48331]|uniref:Mitochondrial export protein Som1 n=3 Tax=Cochliobolus heterostrophus TaxID=5016 RepID=M2SY02_COCH5|nr:uncharacterized protein COCC4DRAFT_57053 [Bipolaris maydis ATCC 48331]EMD90260.1 hypothetical protein COCHEDRAFT_1105473 [Bipolaris maydis C5]KAH7555242.1 hypothetical protein BM1_06865 [Bipolaris maydis]ENI09526.1 hypothetical protein COCC4DRAFT_57053 [Bipolaris maydis ATCC 48331]KAJ5058156.1 mitochondrial export protein Som1 [Bipolaris maydis]KAJ6195405.1 mitochondrial export protein Som1 [Bipolaris maydis]